MAALFRVKVNAGARKELLTVKSPDVFEVWVKAPVERGMANAAVLALVARHLKIEAKRLRIVKGAQSPSKIVTVLG